MIIINLSLFIFSVISIEGPSLSFTNSSDTKAIIMILSEVPSFSIDYEITAMSSIC